MAIQDLTASLDLKQNLNIYATCKQLDNLNLILSIYDNSVQADLNNYNVRLVAMKADKIPLIQEHTGVTINNNIVTIAADEQLTITTGRTIIELQFVNKITGARKATFNLALLVNPSTVNVNGTISTATYTLLEELENKLDQASDFFENIDTAINANSELQDTIASSETAKTNLDGSISTGNTLKTNLNNTISTGNTLKTNLETDISTGNTLKTNLESAITTGNTLLDSLETFEQEHADVTDISNQLASVNTQLSESTQNIKNYGYFGLSANQSVVSVSNPVPSQIVLNNTVIANTDLYSLNNGLITVLKDGVYAIEVLVAWDINTIGFRDARIIISDSVNITAQSLLPCSDVSTKVLLYRTANLEENQTITLSQMQNSGSSLNILSSLTYLKIRKLA